MTRKSTRPLLLAAMLLVSLATNALQAATTATLPPRSVVPIPASVGRYAADVAWENADSVLIASDKGVLRFSPSTRKSAVVISPTALPEGLTDVTAVASDGVSVMATSEINLGGYTALLSDRKRLSAMRVKLLPQNVAVRGDRACLLAFQMMGGPRDVAVWCGGIRESWEKYTPVHRLASGVEIFRSATFGLGGAIAMGEDGAVTLVTSAQAGVFRYAPDGKLIEVLGQSFDELVLNAMREVRSRFGGEDVDGRYRLVLNTQPIIEDLVLTPRGPAIVVRIADKERIHWELWWARPEGRSVPPTRLGIERLGPFGHIRCDARGAMLACVGGLPANRQKAADYRSLMNEPHYLWIFELPK